MGFATKKIKIFFCQNVVIHIYLGNSKYEITQSNWWFFIGLILYQPRPALWKADHICKSVFCPSPSPAFLLSRHTTCAEKKPGNICAYPHTVYEQLKRRDTQENAREFMREKRRFWRAPSLQSNICAQYFTETGNVFPHTYQRREGGKEFEFSPFLFSKCDFDGVAKTGREIQRSFLIVTPFYALMRSGYKLR